MPFPSTQILDDFNRANELPLDNDTWGSQVFDGDGNLQVVSNQCKGFGDGSGNNQGWLTQYGPDCEIYVEIVNISGEDSIQIFARLSAIGGSFDGYSVRARGGATNNLILLRWDDTSLTALATLSQTVSNGDWFGLRLIGNQITVFYKDVSVSSDWFELGGATDSTHGAAGHLGLYIFGSANIIDNFGGGEIIPQGGASLFRGRNFPFFDDDEVNRFEFWPVAAVEHERAVAVTATGSVTVAGQFFSVLTRSAAVNAIGSIETSAQFFTIHERSVGLSATANVSISGAGFSIVERSASLGATATVQSNGTRAVDRSVSVSGTADITVIGMAFSVVEGAAAIGGTGTIETNAEFFTIFELAASVNAVASITVSGSRVVDRAVSVTATGSIETAGQFFTVFERSLSLASTATVTVNGQRELLRSVSLSVFGNVQVAGQVESPTAATHERAAAISALGSIELSAIHLSALERSASLSATATVTVDGLAFSTFGRTFFLTAVGDVAISGSIVTTAIYERSVSFSAIASITITGGIVRPTPPSRTFVVNSARREYLVPRSNRTYIVPEADREEVT